MPELHSAATRRADAATAGVLRRAHRLIAVSESTKRDAVRILGIPPERITVIHSGIPQAFFHIAPDEIEAVRARYGLKRPFVFALGTIEPRKNIPMLLAAFEALPPSLREHFELVLAGPMGWADSATAAQVRNTASARYLGYIPEAGFGAAHRRGGHVRLSIALRRIWISAGAGDGGGRAIRHIEHFLVARNRRRRGPVDRPAQRHRASRCAGKADALTQPSQRTRL